jgi:hypothetical protein
MRSGRRKTCECGCGKVVKPGNRYIHGHNNRNKKMSVQTIAKLSQSLKLFYSDPKERGKSSERQKVAQNRPEVREKKSQTMNLICNTPEARKRNSIAQNKPETRKRRSKSLKLCWSRPEVKEKRSQAAKVVHNRPEVKERHSQATRIRWQNPENREKLRDAIKILWQNSEYVTKQMEARGILPNKQETLLLNLLNEIYPGEWKYTGDFSFTIGGKCPDFINVNGHKKIIELFGDYWHQGENPQDRVDVFKPFGYDTLVIWEHELNNMERVKFRIRKYMRRV